MATIIVKRGRRTKHDPSGFFEAHFDPPQGHAEGDHVIRVYDESLDTPYRQEMVRQGAYSVPGGWSPFHVDYLWDEERELYDAIQAKIATRKR
jgi:hypothetical protein